MPAEADRVTAKVKVTVAPGATGEVRFSAPPEASVAKVEPAGVTVLVVPAAVWVMTRPSLAHRSLALPDTDPDWVQVPGLRVNEIAASVPTFLMVTVVLTVWPGAIAVFPPYLLIVAQVAELVATLLPVPSVLKQVTLPLAFCSCMITVPAPAVSTEFVIDAVNAAKLLFIDIAKMTAPTPPVTHANGVNRRRRRTGKGTG